MANILTPVDTYQLVNGLAKALYGQNTTLQAVDTSTFATVGEAILRTGYENTLNALTMQVSRTIFAVRPFRGSLLSMEETTEKFGMITRKISYFTDGFEASQNWNTQLSPTQLNDGNSIDHYKIRKRYPLEMHFAGLKTLQKHFTRFGNQLDVAFRNPGELAEFYAGLAVEIGNEIGAKNEIENRLTLLNYIAAMYNIGKPRMKVNLTAEFNAENGTSYTSEQLRSTYLRDFLAYIVVRFKMDAALMRERNVLFHLTPSKTDDAGNPLTLLRHTPYDMQRMILYRPLILQAEAKILPEIFHDGLLRIENYEGVNYWQDPNTPAAINVTPNQLDITTGASKTGDAVSIPYVVGVLYDRPALVTSYRFTKALTTPVNAAGDYYNTFYHWAKDFQNDFTENGIIYYMEDPEDDGGDDGGDTPVQNINMSSTSKE